MGLRAVKIDTLELAKELENAGVPRPLAEAHVHTTMKVVDMTIEQDLVTKHDLRHVIKHTEEKLSSKIDKVEDKLFVRINAFDAKIDKFEEKLLTKMDKMDEKFSAEFATGKKETQELKYRVTKIENKIDKVFSDVVFRLGALGVLCTSTIIGVLLKLH